MKNLIEHVQVEVTGKKKAIPSYTIAGKAEAYSCIFKAMGYFMRTRRSARRNNVHNRGKRNKQKQKEESRERKKIKNETMDPVHMHHASAGRSGNAEQVSAGCRC